MEVGFAGASIVREPEIVRLFVLSDSFGATLEVDALSRAQVAWWVARGLLAGQRAVSFNRRI